jgi:hypothetical protein
MIIIGFSLPALFKGSLAAHLSRLSSLRLGIFVDDNAEFSDLYFVHERGLRMSILNFVLAAVSNM